MNFAKTDHSLGSKTQNETTMQAAKTDHSWGSKSLKVNMA